VEVAGIGVQGLLDDLVDDRGAVVVGRVDVGDAQRDRFA
jgi:hypothetical protein